jgi:membrane associated rhomboid family serine protease
MLTKDYTQNLKENIKLNLTRYAYILGGAVLLLWIIEFVDLIVLRGQMDVYGGVHPRTLVGLRNIIISPFMHAGFGHLLANTFPFLILGAFVLIRRETDFFFVTILSAVVSGLGIWLLGPENSVHVGVSGVVFGYLGYLLLRGYFERSITSIVLAVLALIFYGGMIFGLLPFQRGVSWLGHIFGFLGGGLAAYLLAERRIHTSPPREIEINRSN